jgi:hypothetical protein
MILHRTGTVTATTSLDPIFTLLSPNAGGVTIFLENLDPTNYILYSILVSTDNITFNPLVADSQIYGVNGNYNTSNILTPANGSSANQAMISVRTSFPYLQLVASASANSTVESGSYAAQLSYGITTLTPSISINFTNGTL